MNTPYGLPLKQHSHFFHCGPILTPILTYDRSTKCEYPSTWMGFQGEVPSEQTEHQWVPKSLGHYNRKSTTYMRKKRECHRPKKKKKKKRWKSKDKTWPTTWPIYLSLAIHSERPKLLPALQRGGGKSLICSQIPFTS